MDLEDLSTMSVSFLPDGFMYKLSRKKGLAGCKIFVLQAPGRKVRICSACKKVHVTRYFSEFQCEIGILVGYRVPNR